MSGFTLLRYQLLALCLVSLSCGKGSEPATPVAPVSMELYLGSSQYEALRSPGGVLRILEPQRAGDRTGLAGLVVVQAPSGEEYFVYDLACPVEYPRLSRVELEGVEAYCPECKSRYELLSGTARPLSGRASHPLRSYKARYDRQRESLLLSNK